jgi:hypothetical protein
MAENVLSGVRKDFWGKQPNVPMKADCIVEKAVTMAQAAASEAAKAKAEQDRWAKEAPEASRLSARNEAASEAPIDTEVPEKESQAEDASSGACSMTMEDTVRAA